MSKKTFAVSDYNNKIVNIIFIALLAAFMLVIPFYRGLFFRIDYIPAIIFVSIIFAGYMVYKLRDKTHKALDTYMDLSVLLIPTAYLISFFFAVNAKDALDMFLIYCSYFMLYKLTSDLSSKDEKYKNILINVIIASAFILSFASMLNVAGIIDLKGALVGKRLFGLYQYPNTTASVLGVGIILSLNKLLNEGDTRVIAIYQMVLTALVSSFIFTLSRGGYLVLAGVLFLNLLLVKARAKLKMLLTTFVAFLSNSLLIYKFYTLTEENISGIWIHYLLSFIASAIIMYVVYLLKNRSQLRFSDKAINTALIIMVIVFAGTAGFLSSSKEPIEYKIEHAAAEEKSWKNQSIYLYEVEPKSKYTIEFDVMSSIVSQNSYGILIWSYDDANEHKEILRHFEPVGGEFQHKSFEFTTPAETKTVRFLLYNVETGSYTVYKNVVIKDSDGNLVKKMEKPKYIPEAIANRLTDINLKTENVSSRVNFTKDGLKIIKDYLITGAGGGAWKNLYRQYQSIPYNTTEVHNFYVQYGTEVGIIGIAVLIGFLILLLLSMIKNIRAGSSYLYVYLAVVLLLLHSTIDFNLSLAAVGYLLWMLIGIINSDRNTPLIKRLPQKYASALLLVVSLIVFFASSSVYYGMKLGSKGAEFAKENKDTDKAMELLEKASQFDRYNAEYRYDLAQIMNNQLRKTKNRKYYDGFMEQVSLIRKYEPYNHKYTPIICSMYLAIGKLEEGSALAETRLKDEPMLIQSYEMKIDLNYEIGKYYLKEEKVEEAVLYLKKVLETKDQLENTNKNLKKPLKLTEDYLKKLEAVSRTLDMIKADLKK